MAAASKARQSQTPARAVGRTVPVRPRPAPPDLLVVEGPTLLRDNTLRKLKEAIVSGVYPPGSRLVERELIEALGVSRTSVREVLRQLQSEHLIQIVNRRNITVAVITPDEAKDLYWIRELLEPTAVARFIEMAGEQAFRNLAKARRNVHRAVDKGDLTEASEAGRIFCEIIYEGAESPTLRQVIDQLLARIHYLRRRSISQPGRIEAGRAELDAIYAAIERRDATAAAAAYVAHIRNARQAAVDYLLAEQGPEAGQAAGEARSTSRGKSSAGRG